jgi:hypothetical protein
MIRTQKKKYGYLSDLKNNIPINSNNYSCLMKIKKSLTLALLFLITGISGNSQPFIKGIIIEKGSGLPIAFASVVYQKQSVQGGVISDIYGKFAINDAGIKSITVTCVGYRQNKIMITPDINLANIIVELKTDTLSINEVIITPANNPAIRIIRNALANKENNNFEKYEKYRYQCYLKAVYDLKLSVNATTADSTNSKKNRFINKNSVFISESVVICSRFNNQTDNRIIAAKTSGFENPLISQMLFSSFHNSISFYNNNISLFAIPITNDKTIDEYLSPLSDDCLKSYNFLLEESYRDSNDTVFVIEFHPKKDKHFNSLKGRLYISSNGFAIKNIVTEPFEKGLIDFKFRQDYEFINNKWFPTKLNEEIGFVSLKFNRKITAYPVYRITSVIGDVDFNPAIRMDSINNEKVFIDKNFVKNSASILKTARPDSLTKEEKNTYQFMDSYGKKLKLDFMAELYPNLIAGKIPVKFLDIDMNKIYSYNQYEGIRLGIGINTNDKFSGFVSLGGFVGYGFKDDRLKYGGNIIFNISKPKEMLIRLSYQNNLKEPGLDLHDDFTLLSTSEYLRRYIAYRMDNFIEEKAEFNFRLFRFAKLLAALSIKEIIPTYEYYYKGSLLTGYHADEFHLSARYAYGEESATIGNQKIVNYQGNPIINIAYKRGVNLFNEQSYRYNRIEATLDIIAYKGRIGQSDIRLTGGFIDKSVPYSLLFTSEEGSKNNKTPMVINNTFQTMGLYEFLSDKYLNLFYSHNFGSLLFELPKFKPQFMVVQNTGWGSLKNPSYQGIDFKVKDNVYLESGLIINNLIRVKFLNMYYFGFGFGTFYRYGYYSLDKTWDNFALKLSLSISLK